LQNGHWVCPRTRRRALRLASVSHTLHVSVWPGDDDDDSDDSSYGLMETEARRPRPASEPERARAMPRPIVALGELPDELVGDCCCCCCPIELLRNRACNIRLLILPFKTRKFNQMEAPADPELASWTIPHSKEWMMRLQEPQKELDPRPENHLST